MKISKLQDNSTIKIVVELEQCCFPDGSWTEEMLNSVVDSSFRDIFILSQNGVVAGYAIMQIIGDEGEVERIGVHPMYRGQSLGRQLLSNILEQEALNQCFLEVNEHNKVAYHLYKSSGFDEIGRRHGYYHDGADAIMMKWERTANE